MTDRWLFTRRALLSLVAGLLVLSPVFAAEKLATGKEASENRLRQDINYLAAPEREGRGAMTHGLDLAADYVATEMKKAGLKPGGVDGTYFQPFHLDGAVLEEPCRLILKGPLGQVIELKHEEHFHAMGMGGAGSTTDAPAFFAGYGISSGALKYDDYDGADVRGKVVFVIRDVPRVESPEVSSSLKQLAPFLKKMAEAEKQGAAAVVFVNDAPTTADGDDLLDFHYTALSKASSKIPLIHLKRAVLDRMLETSTGQSLSRIEADIDRDMKPRSRDLTGWKVTLEVKLRRAKVIPIKNVIGVLEGSGPLKDETVVVGAHYDHLGYGGQGGSLARLKKREIHHGADDNGSGTTVMMELARRFAAIPSRQGRRLVFMAFSGEELGLLGSAYYVSKPLISLDNTIAMFNLDMVGRLKKDEKTGKEKLLVEGSGTAKSFDDLVDKLNEPYGFSLAKSKNMPPNSDHYSFYKKKIPVLFFWTGIHPDYHKPSDTADKINIEGMRRIADLSQEVITHLTQVEKRPEYIKLQVASSGVRPGNIPRLGIVPSYGDDKEGLLLDDVRDGTPAAKAGLKGGDRIVEMAGKPVKNIQTYMQIMGTQKKGGKLDVVILRAEKKVKVKVTLE